MVGGCGWWQANDQITQIVEQLRKRMDVDATAHNFRTCFYSPTVKALVDIRGVFLVAAVVASAIDQAHPREMQPFANRCGIPEFNDPLEALQKR